MPCHGIMFRLLHGNAALRLAKTAGFDFVIFDLEHGSYSHETLADLMLFAHSVNLGAIVRVPHISRGSISRVLDYGADGVMVPMLESDDQVRELVGCSRMTVSSATECLSAVHIAVSFKSEPRKNTRSTKKCQDLPGKTVRFLRFSCFFVATFFLEMF